MFGWLLRIGAALKNVELGPYDAVTRLLASVPQRHALTLDQKIDLYFIDPAIVPLYIQVPLFSTF